MDERVDRGPVRARSAGLSENRDYTSRKISVVGAHEWKECVREREGVKTERTRHTFEATPYQSIHVS